MVDESLSSGHGVYPSRRRLYGVAVEVGGPLRVPKEP